MFNIPHSKVKLELDPVQVGYILSSLRIATEHLNGPKASLAVMELNALYRDIRGQIEDTRPKACVRCLGFGYVAYFGQQVDCPDCQGTGRINHA